MIQSMTGYGRSEVSFDDTTLIAEVRSLNGKIADVRIKTSLQLGEKELELRKMILSKAERGKLDVTIDLKGAGAVEAALPNVDMIKGYYEHLKQIGDQMDVRDANLYSTILRLPNIFQSDGAEVSDELWSAMREAMTKALERLAGFRKKEGTSIYNDLKERVTNIQQLLTEVAPHEADREESLKERLRQKIEELERESIDQNRFEQEILYYLDKLDINEEKVRLGQHCKYFLEVLDSQREVKGKKLNFISQEIGREINTLGAKAQWSPIQRVVVQMKDNLENIKEQLANAL